MISVSGKNDDADVHSASASVKVLWNIYNEPYTMKPLQDYTSCHCEGEPQP